MKNIILIFIITLITGCTSNVQQSTINQMIDLQSEIDSLKNELYQYKEKYGELKKIDIGNNKFGIWETSFYVDDFGEPTKEGFTGTVCEGLFSNSATTDSDLSVKFVIDESNIRIQLYEYARNHPIKGEGTLAFKAKRGEEMLEFKTYNSDRGDNTVSSEYYDKLISFFQKGGEVKFVATTSGSYSLSEYKFTLIDTSYIKEALDYLKNKNKETL